GRQVVTEPVATVVGGPERAARRIEGQADGVAQAPGEDSLAAALGVVVDDDRGTALVALLADVAARADRHDHATVPEEEHGAGAVAAFGRDVADHAAPRIGDSVRVAVAQLDDPARNAGVQRAVVPDHRVHRRQPGRELDTDVADAVAAGIGERDDAVLAALGDVETA